MSGDTCTIEAHVVDILAGKTFPARVEVDGGKVVSITGVDGPCSTYLLPGFVDAHVHVESSMLLPTEFARVAVVHGTVATVSDPHEIGNVLGVDGIRFMLDNSARVPFTFHFGVPSCVPASRFETAGATISALEVASLLDDDRLSYLSEMMDVGGVLNHDPEVMAKIHAALDRGKLVDGHAPGLRGDEAAAYIGAGISTDHECFTEEEALEKLAHGARILIREGSAARNFDALHELIDRFPDRCMFCSDDKHPDELHAGHINVLVKRAVERGVDVMNVLRCACVNPVLHYGLGVGLLREGDDADFIEVADLRDFRVLRTFLRGQLVAEGGETRLPFVASTAINHFRGESRRVEEFRVPCTSSRIRVIDVIDGQLITENSESQALVDRGFAISNPERDLLKITVVNRYKEAPPAVAFVRNFGLREGALASLVAHDSHNVVAVGVSDEDICAAVNLVIEQGGGLSVAAGEMREVVPLPVAGLMSLEPFDTVGRAYAHLDRLSRQLGTSLRAPFMTLSFMTLLVIPALKLSDRGLFDATRREFVSVCV